APLFQVRLGYAEAVNGVDAIPLAVPASPAVVDLALDAAETPEGLALALAYDPGPFDTARMPGLLAPVGAGAVQPRAHPEAPAPALSLVTESARAALPDPMEPLDSTWRGSVPAIFATRAAERPEAIAVEDAGERWTYAELDAATARIANHLAASGIRPGEA